MLILQDFERLCIAVEFFGGGVPSRCVCYQHDYIISLKMNTTELFIVLLTLSGLMIVIIREIQLDNWHSNKSCQFFYMDLSVPLGPFCTSGTLGIFWTLRYL